jgi:hypothetical protein
MGVRSASRTYRFALGETALCALRVGGKMSPIAGLDFVENRKIHCFCWESNPDSLVIQPAAYLVYTE